MRIYLACTVRGDRSGLEAARAVDAWLRERGHTVLTGHLLDDNVDAAESALDERDVYARDKRWLDDCDVLIAEASGSTYGVGFEVGYITGRAPETGQRVIVLFGGHRGSAISRLIAGYRESCGEAFAYRDAADAVQIVAAELDRVTPARSATT